VPITNRLPDPLGYRPFDRYASGACAPEAFSLQNQRTDTSGHMQLNRAFSTEFRTTRCDSTYAPQPHEEALIDLSHPSWPLFYLTGVIPSDLVDVINSAKSLPR
jgi:hypothetical protein